MIDINKANLVAVIWNDAESNSSWCSIEEIDKVVAPECITVGFLVKKTKKVVVVLSTIDKHVNGSYTLIPRGCVKRIRKLRL
jgi:hypothetical protein